MSCPYLEGKNLKICGALNGAMVLSLGELKLFCATEESFKDCKFFKEIELENKKVDGCNNNLIGA